MKQSKTIMFFAALIAGFATPSFAQVLPEVNVVAVRYKYLSAVNNKELSQPVKLLEMKAAQFDVRNSPFYDDDYDEYHVSFYLPTGYILAAYDKDGKLLRTAEKHENSALPTAVVQSVAKRFPTWTVTSDVYLVNYQEASGANKVWKILLEQGDMRLKVKINEKGEVIE